MANQPATVTSTRWNIFARELELMLARRNLKLSHLYSSKDDQGPIVHPEKVRRLQRSLDTPKNLATLNSDEMRRVTDAFTLAKGELACLRAALLATAVERLLLDRVEARIALQAADEAFKALLRAINQDPPLPGRSGVRDPNVADTYVMAVEIPGPLTQATDAIDRARLALHLSEDEAPTTERIDRAAEAQMGFSRAIAILEQPADVGADLDKEAWASWRDEAIRWKAVASQRLLALLDASKSRQ